MISPLGRDINVQMRRIISADVTYSLEIFNVTEMNKLRRVFEATGEIPDDAAGLIKRNKKLPLWFAIYRPSERSRKDSFSWLLEKSCFALDPKKILSISPR